MRVDLHRERETDRERHRKRNTHTHTHTHTHTAKILAPRTWKKVPSHPCSDDACQKRPASVSKETHKRVKRDPLSLSEGRAHAELVCVCVYLQY